MLTPQYTSAGVSLEEWCTGIHWMKIHSIAALAYVLTFYLPIEALGMVWAGVGSCKIAIYYRMPRPYVRAT